MFKISDERYTPAHIVSAAHTTMGSIDCDPASNIEAQKVVQAKTYYTQDHNGLLQEWYGNIFMNPPYSKPNLGLLVYLFLSKLITEVKQGHCKQAVIITGPDSSTGWFYKLMSLSPIMCLPSDRLKFFNPHASNEGSKTSTFIFYIGPHKDRFNLAFKDIGFVMDTHKVIMQPGDSLLD